MAPAAVAAVPALLAPGEVCVGAIHVGPPRELVLRLRDAHRLTCFVETGTYLGDTAAWAAAHFERVTTIEASRILCDQVGRRGALPARVTRLHGDSRAVLPEVVAALPGPALFWLDGHWSGDQTYGEDDECPLLGELGAICAAAHAHFLLIDDARLFLAPPPAPHRIEQWPPLGEVLDAVRAIRRDYYVVVVEDVIVAVPPYARHLVTRYCRGRLAAGPACGVGR